MSVGRLTPHHLELHNWVLYFHCWCASHTIRRETQRWDCIRTSDGLLRAPSSSVRKGYSSCQEKHWANFVEGYSVPQPIDCKKKTSIFFWLGCMACHTPSQNYLRLEIAVIQFSIAMLNMFYFRHLLGRVGCVGNSRSVLLRTYTIFPDITKRIGKEQFDVDCKCGVCSQDNQNLWISEVLVAQQQYFDIYPIVTCGGFYTALKRINVGKISRWIRSVAWGWRR